LTVLERKRLVTRLVALQVIASRAATPISSVRNSRMTATDDGALERRCAAAREAVPNRLATPGVLAWIDGSAPAEQALRVQRAATAYCRAVPGGPLCFHPNDAN
jgi:hypothetical protein